MTSKAGEARRTGCYQEMPRVADLAEISGAPTGLPDY